MHDAPPPPTNPAFLAGGGEMGALMRAHDWATTPLGPAGGWPQPLRGAVGIMLGATSPMAIYWGADFILLYNDAWRDLIGGKHPRALGRPAREVFAEIWRTIGPIVAGVMAGSGGSEARDQLLPLDRGGGVEDAWFDYGFSPIPLEDGTVGGVLNLAIEATTRVKAERASRASEARYRQIVEGAEDFAIVTLDERGTITSWNSGARCITGFEEAEAVGRPGAIFFTPEDRAAGAPDHEMNRAKSDGRAIDERWHHKKDGTRFWGSGLMMRLDQPGGGYLKIFRDRTAEHEAEAARHESEARVRLMADAVPQIVWITDAEGRIEFLNRRWFEYTGAAREPTTAAEVAAAHLHPDDAAATMAAFDEARRSGRTYLVEHRIRSASGAYRWFLARGEPYRDPLSGEVVRWFGASVDIHDRKLTEGRLRELNETLERRVAERTAERDRIWRVSRDMLGVADEGGIWLSVNPAWTRTLGWDAEEIVGRTSEWLEHPDERGRTRAEVGRLARGHTALAFENRLRGKDGRYRDLSWTAVPVEGRLYCVARDVTEEKVRAKALLLHENIVQSDSAPICAFDTEYRLLAFNRAHSDEFFRIMGHRVRVGEVFPDLLPPDQASLVRGFMARALRGEAFTISGEFGDSDFAKPHWEADYTPLRDATGEIIGAFHHARDVTARLRTEGELVAAQEQLRQSQKMEAVGQLASGIAHDFNNMLQGIGGAVELARSRVERGRAPDALALLDAARQGVARAATLTQRLLAFARRQRLDARPVVLDALVRGMAELIGRAVGPGIAVQTRLADGDWPVLCDANQLESVLLNLALNARDAMPDGGTLTLATREVCLSAADVAGQDGADQDRAGPGEYVEIRVCDTGTGMTAEVAARAFEPFFTTKPIGQGTGLGLSQLYGFVRQSGGLVRLDSAPGRGTTVRLYLPRHTGAGAVARDGAPERAEACPEAAGTVLLVEDEPAVRAVAAEALRELGCAVLEAGDGPEALRLLRPDARVDALVTDVGLPGGMNGRQLAEAAREGRPSLPVLFVTGYAGGALEANLAPGMAAIGKPFALDALAAKVRAMLKTPPAP